MKKYKVTGMSCAACSARVEKAVSGLDGVSACSVNLLTSDMNVEGYATDEAIISAVERAGYGASPAGNTAPAAKKAGSENSGETKKLLIRFAVSAAILLPLMYVSMGHTMWNWPLPPFLRGNHVAVVMIQMILSAVIMIINGRFFVSGVRGLIHGAPNMDTLVSLGSGASFIYSTAVLFAMTSAVMNGDTERVASLMGMRTP